jgi:hypothetical protein
MKSDLKSTSTEQLLAELTRRGEHKNENSLDTIRKRIKSKKLTCAVIVDDEDLAYGPNFMLGIVKDGKFFDFYYSSGIPYGEFQKLIPDNFVETCESVYEYHSPTAKRDKRGRRIVDKSPAKALSVLKKAGYVEFKQ